MGIVRHIDFYNKDFFVKHPKIVIEKKSDSPDKDKSVHNARLLIPTLQDFFAAHPLINPKTFLGDAAFDSVRIYKELLSGDTFGTDDIGNGVHFQKSYIPLNSRAGLENTDYTINADGIPCCPRDSSTGKYHRVCQCETPCSSSPCGRMVYIYPGKDLRVYLGALRGTAQWDQTYKVRTTVERSINHFKDSFRLAGRRTQNGKTLHAGLILAGITQLIGIILADKINQHQYLWSLNPLIA